MNTIEAFENDIGLQLEFLKTFKGQKRLGNKNQKNLVFCGSGDSLISAMLAESFSDLRARSLDPLDLIKNKKLADGKKVFFISISGNTVSNVKAAKVISDTIAVTRNPSSRLGRSCNKVVQLQYNDSKILTSGSVGFLASMLTCISFVYKFEIKNAKSLLEQAKIQTEKLGLKNRVFFLGNQYTFPVCMYAAAKMYEIHGMDAHYERIEQFSHMGLFSAKKGDIVIIFEKPNKHNKQLALNLEHLGMNVVNPSIRGGLISQVVFYTFVSQLLALAHAKRKNIKNCYFVLEKKLRDASSSMIY